MSLPFSYQLFIYRRRKLEVALGERYPPSPMIHLVFHRAACQGRRDSCVISFDCLDTAGGC